MERDPTPVKVFWRNVYEGILIYALDFFVTRCWLWGAFYGMDNGTLVSSNYGFFAFSVVLEQQQDVF